MSTISQQLPPPLPTHRHRISETPSSQTASVGATDATSPTTDGETLDGTSAVGGTGTDAATLDPSKLKDRIEGLLAQQVRSGTLTSAQADTLKGAFGTSDDGPGIGGAGQRPQGPPPDEGDAASIGATTSASSTEDLLASFVKQLQSSQIRTQVYGADGARSGDQFASSLLLNFKA